MSQRRDDDDAYAMVDVCRAEIASLERALVAHGFAVAVVALDAFLVEPDNLFESALIVRYLNAIAALPTPEQYAKGET